MNVGQTNRFWQKFRLPALLLVISLAVVVLAVGVWTVMGDFGQEQGDFVFFQVARSDLPIVVTERGNLEAQLETAIRCEVESLTRDSSGNYGTQIIFIVPNGSAVKEGDLIVELDSASIRERLDEQILRHQKALSSKVQAIARYDNQKLQNETALANAELGLELAQLELKMYEDEKIGTYRLAKDDIQRDADEADDTMFTRRAELVLAETELAAVERLFAFGYRTENQLEQERLKVMRAQNSVAAAANNMDSFEARSEKLDEFDRTMQVLSLRGSVETSSRKVQQVQNDNDSEMAQAEASKIEAERTEEKELERKLNYEEQLTKCEIFAPHDGMVVYVREGRSNSTEIAEGVTVRQRQRILTLPDLSKMQVKTEIHEAVLDQVKPGLPATVRIDAFPDDIYYGFVHDVAVVPSYTGWMSSGVKTYQTVVKIDGEVRNLKPGMTAVVEIHVDRVKDILTVPVQAVVQREGDNWCYVDSQRGVEKRPLELGRSNDKFVHIQDGLAEGERVVLNPMAILENVESDGGISAEDGEPEMPETVARTLETQYQAAKAEASKGPPGLMGAAAAGGPGARMQKKPGGQPGGKPGGKPGGNRPSGGRKPGGGRATMTRAGG